MVKLLLTSAGIKNATLHAALVDLLGKPLDECNALCIPTATYAHPLAGPHSAWEVITGRSRTPMCELGWKSLGVLELTALPSLPRDRWAPLVEHTDALLVAGGEATYLAHWLRESGVAELLPSLRDTVYLGISGGSMAVAPRIGEEFVSWLPATGRDDGVGLVPFSIFPHLDHPDLLPEHGIENAGRWASHLTNPAYAIDDETAIRVVGGTAEVITEGHWELFNG